MKYLVLIIILIILYITYVSPYIHNYKKVTNDSSLLEKLALLEMCKKFDDRSYNKGMSHFKSFMMRYSNSFSTVNHSILNKMKKSKHKSLYYFRRILFRVHNDANLYENVQNTLESLNTILDNYLVETANRKGDYYYNMYS